MEWMLMPLKRYAEFSGRSRRKEFWMFALLNVIVYAVIMALIFGMADPSSLEAAAADGGMSLLFGGFGILLTIWWLAVFIPSIAVSIRRLHDRDMSGWWYLGVIVVSFIPFVGFIAMIAFLVVMVLPGTAGTNRFGDDPKDPANAETFS